MPDIELDPHEWRLKGTKRIKPFKPQPKIPPSKPIYYSPVFSVLAWIFGIWAACVITLAHSVPGQDPWVIALISLGPIGIMLGLMVFFDN